VLFCLVTIEGASLSDKAIRLVLENPMYRYPEKEDIVPGATFFTIEHDASLEEVLVPYREIELHTVPIVGGLAGSETVLGLIPDTAVVQGIDAHTKFAVFVPMSTFLALPEAVDNDPFITRYVLHARSQPTPRKASR
jgi:hypothetical protein